MKLLTTALITLLLSLTFISSAQDFQVPADLPSTKEDFIKSEPDFIAAAKWLESTAIANDMDKRTKVNAWVIAWISNSPTVTIEIRGAMIKPFDKNPQLLSVYMAGFTRYSLENNYSKDELLCNIAAMKSVVKCCNLGGEIKKDKNLTKLLDADKEGKLEDWIKEALTAK